MSEHCKYCGRDTEKEEYCVCEYCAPAPQKAYREIKAPKKLFIDDNLPPKGSDWVSKSFADDYNYKISLSDDEEDDDILDFLCEDD